MTDIYTSYYATLLTNYLFISIISVYDSLFFFHFSLKNVIYAAIKKLPMQLKYVSIFIK